MAIEFDDPSSAMRLSILNLSLMMQEQKEDENLWEADGTTDNKCLINALKDLHDEIEILLR